jgi:hypothetical protein
MLQIYYFINQVHGPEILVPGTSEVLVITNTPKKHPRRSKPKARSHQDEENSGTKYFSYTVVVNIQEVHPSCKRRKLQSLGAVIVGGLGKTSEII